jgi:hypothetical protein
MAQDILLPVAEPTQLALPLALEAQGTVHGTPAIETDFPILEVSRLAKLESCQKDPGHGNTEKVSERMCGCPYRANL